MRWFLLNIWRKETGIFFKKTNCAIKLHIEKKTINYVS